MNSTFHKFPRGQARAGSIDDNPLKWTSRYGSLSLIGYDLGTHKGVNEAGLSAHLLFLANETDYGKRDPSLEDKTGDSAIIEWINGKPKVWHGKEYRVMTNEPTYDKQMANLKNYRTFGGDQPLPGERLPMDRFVRASYYVRGLPTPQNSDQGVAWIMSVMRNVSVPYGAADPERPNVANTTFRSVIDLTQQRYFFESTLAPNIVWVDYSKLDFSPESGESELRVEKQIMSLSGNVVTQFKPVANFVWKRNQ
ncbi:linear amide C-N hydrolase [Pantoea sp.]|uniref:linear amide C-N hydrolase n=1 Tax=Pantoea sp. TaxID=69393 RepID=UPI0028A15ECC|nr:linear amide C-N hydrolase [Pantoea sp.]